MQTTLTEQQIDELAGELALIFTSNALDTIREAVEKLAEVLDDPTFEDGAGI